MKLLLETVFATIRKIISSSVNVHFVHNPDEVFWWRWNLSIKEIRRNLNGWEDRLRGSGKVFFEGGGGI